MYSMRFDMRAPDFGASPVELYEAAVDMCEWAETRGCLAAVICEHHSSPDGYLPTPLILGSAVAARTKQLMMTLIVILPFYDPVRLAEEIAVLDLISKGRASYVFGLGYRPEEYQHFGLDRKARGRIADEKLGLLRRLLAGEVVEQDGRRIKLTPLPFSPQGPLMMWGGGSLAAARRAGRYGLGYLAQGDAPGSQQAYEEACRAHGHEPGMTLLPNRDTPSVCFVAPGRRHGLAGDSASTCCTTRACMPSGIPTIKHPRVSPMSAMSRNYGRRRAHTESSPPTRPSRMFAAAACSRSHRCAVAFHPTLPGSTYVTSTKR